MASLFSPIRFSVWKAYKDELADVAKFAKCSSIDRVVLIVIPNITIEFTLGILDVGAGSAKVERELPRIIISLDLPKLSFKLLLFAQLVTLSSSSGTESVILTGMSRYVSSAYLNIRFL